MGAAKNDFGAGRAYGVSKAIGSRRHSRHRTDSSQLNVIGSDELRNLGFRHRLRVSINQKDLMLWRRESFEQKHPEVRHEISGHAIVGTVKEDIHFPAFRF